MGIVNGGLKTALVASVRFSFHALIFLFTTALPAEQSTLPKPNLVELSITGHVVDGLGKQVDDVSVKLRHQGSAESLDMLTGPLGSFSFGRLIAGHYSVEAEGLGRKSQTVEIDIPATHSKELTLILVSQSGAQVATTRSPVAAEKEMEFSDKADFTVAGVTDWTAVGGHGSDATLRTSESLARETLSLQSSPVDEHVQTSFYNDDTRRESEAKLRFVLTAAPRSYVANRELGEFYLNAAKYQQALAPLQAAFEISQHKPDDEYNLALACRGVGDFEKARQHVQHALTLKDSANLHRLAGDLAEQMNDPLAAVSEMRQATQLDPSEENYLAWGAELLLHRAVWQASEVFQDGVKAFPGSTRLKMAAGAALFSGALYERAAQQLCEASDLNPANTEPYGMMGKIELASPAPLPCILQRLARFLEMHPESANANFFQAMVLLREGGAINQQQAEHLLANAVSLDPHYSDAYLQLGILSFGRHRYEEAVQFYTKSIDTNSKQGEAHYRLALAYERMGDAEKAKQEFRIHDEITRAQAATVEQERRKIKQFLVVTDDKHVPELRPPSP